MDQATQTERRRRRCHCFGLTGHNVLNLICSLLLPLVLGIVTIINSDQQQKETIRQQERDVSLRQQELKIAYDQEALQRELALDQYRDNLLVSYVKEIGDFLERNNNSLASYPIMATIARAKTLNTVRQLDSSRISNLIHFLYETKQLTDTNETHALDISTAVLVNINETIFQTVPSVGRLSLRGVVLRYCGLDDTSLHNIDLSSTKISHMNFSTVDLNDINISSVELNDVDFTSVSLTNIDFAFSRLARFFLVSTRLTSVGFHFATLQAVDFSQAQLYNVTLASSHVHNTRFGLTMFRYVNFSSAKLTFCSFDWNVLENVDFSFAELNEVNFSNAQLTNVNFTSAVLRGVRFTNATLVNVQFSLAVLVSTDFEKAFMQRTIFERARRLQVSFDHANLFMSTFWQANLKDARFHSNQLTTVNFSQANLQKVYFTNAYITDGQLRSALSIQNARLANGTLGRDRNLIENCPLTLKQTVNLSKIWDSYLWPYSRAVLNVRTNKFVTIQLIGLSRSGEVLALQNSSMWTSIDRQVILRLEEDMQQLEIQIYLQSNETQWNHNSCDDIHLFIDYGTEWESFQANIPNLSPSTTWSEEGITVAGGYGKGSGICQLNLPCGLYVDDDDTIFIADQENDRIVAWKKDTTCGHVVAGGKGKGKLSNQFNGSTDVLVDKETDSFIICDLSNRRVMRWTFRNGTITHEALIENIGCYGLAMDDQRNLYVSDITKDAVRRYRLGETQGILVAGERHRGNGLHQLNYPTYIFVDKDYSVYVSDHHNHRVVKWMKGAREAVLVAGGHGRGAALSQISYPQGVIVDLLGTIYVADSVNHRVTRWDKGASEGTIIVGSNGKGDQADQLQFPSGLSFDQHGYLYVVDQENARVQRFSPAKQ